MSYLLLCARSCFVRFLKVFRRILHFNLTWHMTHFRKKNSHLSRTKHYEYSFLFAQRKLKQGSHPSKVKSTSTPPTHPIIPYHKKHNKSTFIYAIKKVSFVSSERFSVFYSSSNMTNRNETYSYSFPYSHHTHSLLLYCWPHISIIFIYVRQSSNFSCFSLLLLFPEIL